MYELGDIERLEHINKAIKEENIDALHRFYPINQLRISKMANLYVNEGYKQYDSFTSKEYIYLDRLISNLNEFNAWIRFKEIGLLEKVKPFKSLKKFDDFVNKCIKELIYVTIEQDIIKIEDTNIYTPKYSVLRRKYLDMCYSKEQIKRMNIG